MTYNPGEVRLVEAIRAHLGDDTFREVLRSFPDELPYQEEQGMWCMVINGWTWFLAEEGLACKTTHDGLLFVGVARDGEVHFREPVPLRPNLN